MSDNMTVRSQAKLKPVFIGRQWYKLHKSEKDLVGAIEENNIRVIYSNEYHLKAYTDLQIAEGHKDINDHAIIAQAISDRIPLISSDHEFKNYTDQGLDFILNRR